MRISDWSSDVCSSDLLLEVARRGIPTIKGLAGDDAGATGDLGIFVGVRLLQDRFRGNQQAGDGLLPVIGGSAEDATIAIVVPVDPFRGYISDLCKALGKERGDLTQLRRSAEHTSEPKSLMRI